MRLVLKVRIADIDGNDILKVTNYGLHTGLSLVREYREKHPKTPIEKIQLNEWSLVHCQQPIAGDQRLVAEDGTWNIPLTEALAESSGLFENHSVVVTEMGRDAFMQSVSMQLDSAGATPVIDRQKVFDTWAAAGFPSVDA